MADGASFLKPRRIQPGDVVGVAAPAGVVDEARLGAGLRVRVAAIDGVKDINEALQQDLREAVNG